MTAWPYFATPLDNLGDVRDRMHRRIMEETTYCGIATLKNPTDAWVYEELIWRLRPDVIVEIGNYHGGHLLRLAHFCDAIGHGEIVGVDLERVTEPAVLAHPRIDAFTGEACDLSSAVYEIVGGRSAFVIEDSAHTEENTLAVLRSYADLIRPGGYLVVEDTIGVEAMRAVETFLEESAHFQADRSLEGFGVSFNPMGFLRRL